MSAAPTTNAAPATSRPYLALGLTFLLLGAGFALPFRLAPAPPKHIWDGAISVEALNLYALTAFAGWAHFVYAWRGQWIASRRFPSTYRFGYWAAVAAVLIALVLLRLWLGVAVFSILAWIYNIAHFVKAEVFFSGVRKRRTAYYSPVAAFAWFTVCLFQVEPLRDGKIIFAGSLGIAAMVLACGGWKMLASGEIRLPLLTLFLLGETLVWAGYSPHMSDAFRVGVYIFHIAAASFYHYLTAYFFAESRDEQKKDAAIRPASILAINVGTILIGLAVAWVPAFRWLRPLAGLEWFTLWVALHLAASDLQPLWRKRAATAR